MIMQSITNVIQVTEFSTERAPNVTKDVQFAFDQLDKEGLAPFWVWQVSARTEKPRAYAVCRYPTPEEVADKAFSSRFIAESLDVVLCDEEEL